MASRISHEAQVLQIELLDEGINNPDWIILGHPVIQPLRKQEALRARLTLNESTHRPLLSLEVRLSPSVTSICFSATIYSQNLNRNSPDHANCVSNNL
jgi:hypothetical protein